MHIRTIERMEKRNVSPQIVCKTAPNMTLILRVPKNGRKYQKTEQRYSVILPTLRRNNAKYIEEDDTINRLIYYKLEFAP